MPLERQHLIALACVAGLACPTLARAEVKPTLRDRVEQIVATFMGDPAANVDIDLKRVLDTWRGMKPKPLDELSPQDARRQPSPIDAASKLLADQGKSLDSFPLEVKDITFPGAAGDLKGRLYLPKTLPDQKGKAPPVVVFFHGGGFVLENAAGTDASARAIAANAEAIVFAPDYRLAPEHPFPAAPDDALAAYKWVLSNAASFGGDPNRIALAGEGAGGTLAVDTAIAARDAKLPKAAALALIAPGAGVNLKTNSWLEDSAARPWNKEAVQWAIGHYLPNKADREDPRMDIVGRANVDSLPMTIIVTAEDDPLRSDGERLGGKLKRVTVPVDMRDYPGMTHDFFGMGAAVEKAAEAEWFVGTSLKTAFGPHENTAVALEQMGIAPYKQAPDPVTPPATDTIVVPKP